MKPEEYLEELQHTIAIEYYMYGNSSDYKRLMKIYKEKRDEEKKKENGTTETT